MGRPRGNRTGASLMRLTVLPYCSKFDLYTKCPDLPDVDKLRPYYQGLIDKYCPGVLSW
jgi:hypothetical protein